MRSVIACAVVAVLSLFAALDYYGQTAKRNEQQPDYYRIGHQKERFQEIAKELPEDGVVGYVSNLDTGTVAGGAAFFGAQYVLTPRILVDVRTTEPGDLVVGNFSVAVETSDITSMLAREHDLRVVRDYDAGVVLFRKRQEQ